MVRRLAVNAGVKEVATPDAHMVQALTKAPGNSGRALPGKAWHKILRVSDITFIYNVTYIFRFPWTKAIILYRKRYTRHIDMVVLQLEKETSFYVNIWRARLSTGHKPTAFWHEL